MFKFLSFDLRRHSTYYLLVMKIYGIKVVSIFQKPYAVGLTWELPSKQSFAKGWILVN